MVSALVCPDKFKGTLVAADAAAAMAAGLRHAGFDDVAELPLADGGEGTLDALLAALGGSRRTVTVTGPLGDPVDAEWALLPGGVAIVEMARASGLALAPARARSVPRVDSGHGRTDRGHDPGRGASRRRRRRRRARPPTAGSPPSRRWGGRSGRRR